jgi:hypothetical protein
VSVWRLAKFVASLLSIACRRAAILSGVPAVLGRIRAIIGGWLARAAGGLGLIRFERVADCGAHVATAGCSVTLFSRAISRIGVFVGLIAVIPCSHWARE